MSVAPFPAPKPETVAQRVRRLQAEAKALAASHVRDLIATLAEAEALAVEIAEGGEVYGPGVRDEARRAVEDLAARAERLNALLARAAR